ncbi:MAG: RecQ family ATP-dependent DNA helicase [Acidobacteriota bacterium]|nr:RecQ family ATP-dependent DNA helicase [Acidobacteriota bacterium]
MATIEETLSELRKYFGFADFREGQREVVRAILEGHDTVVVMPTGGGKSLCYQLPAMMLEGATLVVSPLIALMKDQVDALHARGLPATFINSSIDFEEQKARINGVRRGDYKMVYVAPERFRSAHFVEAIKSAGISLFAIDEAHCISQWGHDFRPDYLRLKSFIEQVGRPQIVALTATATPHVRADIIEQLSLRTPRAFVSGFDRPNLSINIAHTQNDREKIARIKALTAAHPGGSGIIYTSTRKSAEQVTARLREARLSVIAYHAGMEDAERARVQDEFMSGRVQMIVATNAFGMGIDKPDIRFVAHYQLPGSVEAYYQEIGRAGRDGRPSTCVLLFNYADKRTQDYFIEGSYPAPELIAKVYESLIATGQRRIELSIKEIAARAGVRNEMAVQSSLIVLEKAGHIERGAARENRAGVRLLVPPPQARETIDARRSTQAKQVLFGLLGGCEVSQRAETEIDVAELAETLGIDISAARRALQSLAEGGIISYNPARRTRGVAVLDETPARRLRVNTQDLARRAALEQRKLREVIGFCYTEECYRAVILDYFGDHAHADTCGQCGNCMSERKGATKSNSSAPLDPATALDKFVMKHAPVALDLEDSLREQSRLRHAREEAERFGSAVDEQQHAALITAARDLSADEVLDVRKILSCAARMGGRFGKGLLVATLRGSRAKTVSQAKLDKLSTYGILAMLTQEELMVYIDALISAGCLTVTTGVYPTVSLTTFGSEVMRGRADVRLALPAPLPAGQVATPANGVNRGAAVNRAASFTGSSSLSSTHSSSLLGRGDNTTVRRPAFKPSTIDETYALYDAGLSVEEISERRGLTEMTIEKHLADCILEGRPLDLSRFVSDADRALIEQAIDQLGDERLRPLRDALPTHITYGMIRFVVADLQCAAHRVQSADALPPD